MYSAILPLVLDKMMNVAAAAAGTLEEVSVGELFIGMVAFSAVSITVMVTGIYWWKNADKVLEQESQLIKALAEKQTELHRLEYCRNRAENISQNFSDTIVQIEILKRRCQQLHQAQDELKSQLVQNDQPDGANPSLRVTRIDRTLSSHTLTDMCMDVSQQIPPSIADSASAFFQRESRPGLSHSFATKHAEVDAEIEFTVREIEESQAKVELFIDSSSGQQLLTQGVSI